MLLYSGIDLHTNNSMIMLISAQDEESYQQQSLNDLSTILEQ